MGIITFLQRALLPHTGGTLGPEVRHIVLAQGLQFNNSDMPGFCQLPDALSAGATARNYWKSYPWCPQTLYNRPALALDIKSSTQFEYLSTAQNVRYIVERVLTKNRFKQALETPDVHVIYAGHARYGRGPCFGTNNAPGEDWENGTRPNVTGLFRMGFPYIGIPGHEVSEHEYTVDLVSADVKLEAKYCEPQLAQHLSNLKALTLDEIDKIRQANAVSRAAVKAPHLFSGHKPLGGWGGLAKHKDPKKTYWIYNSYESGVNEIHLVIHAGWQNTASKPMDLDATKIDCRVFCHFGCSTYVHNQRVVRKFKGWEKNGDAGFAYFTTDLSHGFLSVYWLYHLFTYDKPNQLWEPSLSYAFKKTNADLSADKEVFRII
jgi:hypothetical protein